MALGQEPENEHSLKQPFLDAMGNLATTVAVVTTNSGGQRSGLTATALCSATVEPPSMLICINKTAGTHAHIGASGRYCVNILHTGQANVARAFAGITGWAGEDRFTLVGGWTTMDGLPVLKGALSSVACVVSQSLDIGTHTVFVGEVSGILANAKAEPLLYADRTFSRLVPLAG